MLRKKFWPQKPFSTLTQFFVLLLVIFGLTIALDLNQRAQTSRSVGIGEESLEDELAIETTRQVELQATLSYVQSEDYIAAYARNEGGYILPGEKRVVPIFVEGTPVPTAAPPPTPDPALQARPWQAWWQMLTDTPLPTQ